MVELSDPISSGRTNQDSQQGPSLHANLRKTPRTMRQSETISKSIKKLTLRLKMAKNRLKPHCFNPPFSFCGSSQTPLA